MGKQIHPAVAVLVVAVALGAIWFCYTFVFSGKRAGFTNPGEAGVSMAPKAPPVPGERGPAPPEHTGPARMDHGKLVPAGGTGPAAHKGTAP